MATYDWLFNMFGLRNWCDADASEGPMSMAQLLAKTGNAAPESSFTFGFPSLDELHKACGQITQTRDVVKGLEDGFLSNSPRPAYGFGPNHSATLMDAGRHTLRVHNSALVYHHDRDINCCLVCHPLHLSCLIQRLLPIIFRLC